MKINRIEILQKTNGRCAYCGEELNGKFQIDHIIPQCNFENYVKEGKVPPFLTHLTEDDVNHKDNLFASCQPCNRSKGVFTIEGYRKLIEGKPKQLRLTANYREALRYNLIIETNQPVKFYFETL
jgi:5-methylcytosine-specific restriction endonuclease McrA